MKYCPDCGKKIKSKDDVNCCYCGYSIISVLNGEILNKNLLMEKIDRFYEEYIEQKSFSLEKQLADEENNYRLLPSILYISFVPFFGLYAAVAFFLWPMFSKEKNILELLIFCFPIIYVQLNLFRIRSSIKKNREKPKIYESNIKKMILDKLQLKWEGSIDSLEFYNNSYLFFGWSMVFLFLFYIPIYDPIFQIIFLLVLSLIIDCLIFKLGIFGPKTKIYNDFLSIKKHLSRKYKVIKWTDIESVEVVIIDSGEYSSRFFKLNLKNHKKPVRVSFSISNEEILETKKKFIEFMSSTNIDYPNEKDLTIINKNNEKKLETKLKNKNCSNCGANYDKNALYCHRCGKARDLEIKFCPYCGNYKIDKANFCHICGNMLKVPIFELKQIDNTENNSKSQKIKFCSLCGYETNGDQNVCPYCGNIF